MSPKNRVSDSDYEMLGAFRYALRRFLRFGEEAAREAGLTPQQHQTLLAVRSTPRGRMTIGQLAERLQIRHHSAVGMVDRLSAEGLVRRQHGTEDRREVYVSLTPKGAKLLDGLASAHRDELKRAAPELHGLLKKISGR